MHWLQGHQKDGLMEEARVGNYFLFVDVFDV